MIKVLGSPKTNAPWTTGHRDYIIEATILENGVRKTLTYYEMVGQRHRWGSELYQGRNYIVGSSSPSYSRNFVGWKGMPSKYLPIAKRLKAIHKRRFAGK